MNQRTLVVALVFVVLAAACSGGGDEPLAPDPDPTATGADHPATTQTSSVPESFGCDEPVVVGVITDMSGGLSLHGNQLGHGVSIGFADAAGDEVSTGPEQVYTVDGCEIRVLFRDDQSNPETATIAAHELVEGGAGILIGSAGPDTTSALHDLALAEGVILIAAMDTAPGLTGAGFSPNTFMVGPTVDQHAMAICSYLVEGRGLTRFAQLAPDYAYGHRAAHAYRDACTSVGASFVAPDVLAPTNPQSGFVDYLEPLVDLDPDAFLVTWTGGGLLGVTQTATAIGLLDADTALATPFLANPLTKALLVAAVGSTSSIAYHYTVPDNASNEGLIGQSNEVFDVNPDLYDAAGMNAALMVIAGLRVTRGATDDDSLRSAFEGLGFVGPKGQITVRPEDHVAIQDIFMVTLLNTDDPQEAYYEHKDTVRPEPPCLLAGDYAARCGELPVGSLGG